PRLLDAVEARATAPAGLDVEDVRAVLAAWGMEANVTFSRDVYERGEEAVKRLRAALVASGETDR
ncbi:MAG TPA: hypothetical protein VFP22_00585, partial [Candidatus Limnocylindrales bacterium]|nr:hypothetical protein [Candidatus Limnocylindrales bacterium]